MHEENQKKFCIVCYFAWVTYFSETETELDMDWIHPWIGLDWIGSLFFRRRKQLRLVFLSLKCIFGFQAN